MARNTISISFDTDNSLSQDVITALLDYMQSRIEDVELGAEVTNVTGYCTTPWTPGK